MAGLEHFRVALDPAIQKLTAMTGKRTTYFRWTPRTAGITFMYAVVVPGILGTLAYQVDGKWDFRAKRRGDLLSEY